MLACSAGVFFERAICSRKRHVILSPIFHCHKIKDGGYNNITNTNKVSPAQNTPALQARYMQDWRLTIFLFAIPQCQIACEKTDQQQRHNPFGDLSHFQGYFLHFQALDSVEEMFHYFSI